ncbi:hypothetical protein FHW11_004346 [Pantoea agglomerans]|uniref:hypothetical protein n=1 Tax=Enterobacter agglomerans TaxID=549 RepID=UPI0015F7FE09|nr:hypothetical protein [Pantoea agglomerans]MBA8867157.1 hypothetical protein [Pantoea agglomerans]MBA8894288.1 hypothetical protein [Pantoea agglomerans]
MTNNKNSKPMAFIKCHRRWFVFVLLIVLGFLNGYIATLTAAISFLTIIKRFNSKSSDSNGSPSLIALTICSLALAAIPTWEAYKEINPKKENALKELTLTIQNDADRCMPATEKDREQWLNIKSNTGLLCELQINKEQQVAVYKLQNTVLGVISNSFSLASTFFPDPPTKSKCLELLDDYQRICPCVPGSEFDEQLKTFKKNYVLPNAVHSGMIEQKTCNSK